MFFSNKVSAEPSAVENEERTSLQGSTRTWIFALGVIAVCGVLFFLFNTLTHGVFLEWSNIQILLGQMVWPSFMAWGMTFLFACGYTDLSWGAVVVLGSFATGVFGNMWGLGGAIIAGVLVGSALVFINFCVFSFTKIPSWIAGISLAMVYEAVSVFLKTNAKTGPLVEEALHKELQVLAQLPQCLIILVIGFVIIYFIYNKTSIGFNIRSIGGNQKVALALGVNLKKTLLWVGLITGLLIGVTSFLQESYSGYTTVKTGLTSIFLIFQPLAIALLADIMQKRINVIIAVPLCSFLLFAVFNCLTLMHVESGTYQEAILGLFLIVFGVVGQRKVKGVVK
jgi:ribose/xylose/arabinose/galactoside ABC-type transport system permease subunit